MSLVLKNIHIEIHRKQLGAKGQVLCNEQSVGQAEHAVVQHILLSDFNYTVQDGTVLTIMGASGSGKSTLLHYITGIYDKQVFICSGQVLVHSTDITQQKTQHRKIGFLSQEMLLFPHMTVAENLLYALPAEKKIVHSNKLLATQQTSQSAHSDFSDTQSTVRPTAHFEIAPPPPKKQRKIEQQEIVAKALAEVQLDMHFAHKYPIALSGGQQARLALARTLLSEPRLLLLDEPFSKLDAYLRESVRALVWQKVETYQIPTLLVTHDKADIYHRDLVYTL